MVPDGLEIDGRRVLMGDDCAGFSFGMPNLVYEEDNGAAVVRFLGAQGFQLTILDPSERLRALRGAALHTVKVTSQGMSITHVVQFREEWTGSDGTRKLFASLANERDAIAKWGPELAAALPQAQEGELS
jgi:hypothetical protein